MITVATATGSRKVDVTNKMIELSNGVMTPYTSIDPRSIDGVPHFFYMVCENGGVAVTAEGHRSTYKISEAQKKENAIEENVRLLNNEGYYS
ncbi:MAG: hypothetical protein PF444_03665 [Bacteroidales bacterium]|jgi:hypothetical protein|nr:hypothetical protein [Bacteroidales bacterium]